MWLVEAMMYRHVPSISYDESGFVNMSSARPSTFGVHSLPLPCVLHKPCNVLREIDRLRLCRASAIQDELWRHGCNHVAGQNARDAWNYTGMGA